MKFKQWIEDSAARGSGDVPNPDEHGLENGLKRPQYSSPVPESPIANNLFGAGRKRHGKKFMVKDKKPAQS